jgi:hypothetical protein
MSERYRVTQLLRRRADTEGMGPPAALRAGFATLVFPVVFFYEGHIDSPNHHRPTGLDRLRGINQVAPDNVPAGMVVVGLNRPGTRTPLRFERQFRRRVEFTAQRQVGKPLLSLRPDVCDVCRG